MRKRLYVALIVIAGILFFAACGGKDDKGQTDSVVHNSNLSGEELYMQSCASCHGKDFKAGYAPDLDKIGGKYTVEELEDIIINGYKSMPNGLLKGEDAKKVAEWLAQNK